MTTRDYVLLVYESLKHTIDLRMLKDAFVTDVEKDGPYTRVYVTLHLEGFEIPTIIEESSSLSPKVQAAVTIALFEGRYTFWEVPDEYIPTYGLQLTRVLASAFIDKAERYLEA